MGFVLVKRRHRLVRGEQKSKQKTKTTLVIQKKTAALKFAYKGFGL
jgi:hypothetical protein